MGTSRFLLWGVALLGVVTGSFLLGARMKGSGSPPADTEAISALQQQLLDLKTREQENAMATERQLRALQEQVATNKAASMPLGPTTTVGYQAVPARETPPKIAASEIVAILEAKLPNEVRDPAWSVETERQVQSVFRQPQLAGISLVDNRCASSYCRLEVAYRETPGEGEPMSKLTQFAPFNNMDGLFRTELRKDGSSSMVLVFSRPSHSLHDLAVNGK
ncbi:MAG: hypothetical protein HY698_07345 [Deltaproteobacteria bacterium]|nr:hypothetical protein [Deltaproteobacteria bacterium]